MNPYFLPFTLRRASYSTGFAIWDKISNYGQRCQEWLKFCIQVLPMFCPTPTFELNVFSGLEYDLPLCSIQLVPYSQRREYLISPRSSQRKVNRRFGHNAQQNRAKSSVWNYMPVRVLLKFHSSRQILDPLPRASRHGVRW